MPLAFVLAGAAQSHALVQQAVVTDNGGLADHHAHAVVDEQTLSDLRTGMDLDAGLVSCTLGYDASNGIEFVLIEPVGTPIAAHCFQPGVCQQNFKAAACRRVFFLDDGDIFP